MADLNALIAQGYQMPAPPDPFAQYAKMQQLDQGEQTNQLNRMKMQEYQRGMEETNALRGVVSRSGFDPMNPTHQAEAYAAAPTLAPKYLESILTTKESAGKITAADIKAKTDKRALLGQAHRDISGNPSDAQITAHLEDVLASSVFSPTEKAMVQQSATDLLALPYEQRQMKLSMQGSTAADLKPQVVGASSSVYNPITGKFTQAPAAPKEAAKTIGNINPGDFTPASLARFNTSGNYGDLILKPVERAPRPEAAPRTQQVTLNDGSLGIVNMDTGVITRSTVDGAPVKGKPSAFTEKTAEQQKQMKRNLDVAISELTDATKDGGLIDQSTGSGAGRLIDIGAGFVGQATKGATAISKLQPIADLALKMVPRFEGPQSNADTISYKQAAGQLADPTLPTAIRKEAGKTVLRLMQNRKDQFMSADMEASGQRPTASTGVDTSNPLLN